MTTTTPTIEERCCCGGDDGGGFGGWLRAVGRAVVELFHELQGILWNELQQAAATATPPFATADDDNPATTTTTTYAFLDMSLARNLSLLPSDVVHAAAAAAAAPSVVASGCSIPTIQTSSS
ncbi:hypothetical protein ACA910_011598 [Epithemia clementina (nom. ined.)]